MSNACSVESLGSYILHVVWFVTYLPPCKLLALILHNRYVLVNNYSIFSLDVSFWKGFLWKSKKMSPKTPRKYYRLPKITSIHWLLYRKYTALYILILIVKEAWWCSYKNKIKRNVCLEILIKYIWDNLIIGCREIQ